MTFNSILDRIKCIFIVCITSIFLFGCGCLSYETTDIKYDQGFIADQDVAFFQNGTNSAVILHTGPVNCSLNSKAYHDDDCTCDAYYKCSQTFVKNEEYPFELDHSSLRRGGQFEVFFAHQYFRLEQAFSGDDATSITIGTISYDCYEVPLVSEETAYLRPISKVYACEKFGVVKIITKNGQTWIRKN
jgi:hypothetical protein